MLKAAAEWSISAARAQGKAIAIAVAGDVLATGKIRRLVTLGALQKRRKK